jgi:hypothetical protein
MLVAAAVHVIDRQELNMRVPTAFAFSTVMVQDLVS